MTNALVSIQIIPKTPNGEDVIPYVDAAIAVIDEQEFLIKCLHLKRQWKVT